MYIRYNKKYVERARVLRNNMTPEERKIWYDFLSKNQYRFTRQKIIENYIVDFYCPKKKLIIEIDGNQHYTVDGKEYDKIRTDLLNAYNLTVLRYKNKDIQTNFTKVCSQINQVLNNKWPKLVVLPLTNNGYAIE